MKESTRVLVGLGAGLAGGAAIAASGNARLAHAAAAIAPLGVLWVNAIRMTVIPLVVSLMITGVASAADLRTIGRIGGRTLLAFLALLLGVAIVSTPLVPLAFAWLPHGTRRPRSTSAGRGRGRGPDSHRTDRCRASAAGSTRSSPPIQSPPPPTARCSSSSSSPCCSRSRLPKTDESRDGSRCSASFAD